MLDATTLASALLRAREIELERGLAPALVLAAIAVLVVWGLYR